MHPQVHYGKGVYLNEVRLYDQMTHYFTSSLNIPCSMPWMFSYYETLGKVPTPSSIIKSANTCDHLVIKEIVSRQNMVQGCFSLNPFPQLPWLLLFEPTVSIVSNTYWCHWYRGDIPWRCQRYEWRVSLTGVIDNVERPTVSAIEEVRASSKSPH